VLLGLAVGACQIPGRSGGESAPAADAGEASGEAANPGSDTAQSPGAEAPAQGARATADANARQSAPAATPEPIVIPPGTGLVVALGATYSSATNAVGDAVVARLADDVSLEGRVVLPAGTEVRGAITGAKRSGRTKGRARLALAFDRIVVDGRNREIAASGIDITADDSKKRDAALIGGGAGAGAIVGGIAKGGKGAAVGGLIGGAAGTAAVLTTRGKEVEFPAGTQLRIVLEAPLQLR
jgi:hypothetical protein